MVNVGEISSIASKLSSNFSGFKNCLSDLNGSWKGSSYEKLISEAENFTGEYESKILEQLSAFAEAINAYSEYKQAKQNYNISVSNYNNAAQANDKNGISRFQSDINYCRNIMNTQKERITSALQKVNSIKLEATSNAAVCASVASSISSKLAPRTLTRSSVYYSANHNNRLSNSGGSSSSSGGNNTPSSGTNTSSSTNSGGSTTTSTSSSGGTPISVGDLVYPLANYRVTSEFGYRGNIGVAGASKNHKGIDLGGNPVGTEIYAVKGGTVTAAQWMSGYGYVVFIDHGDGMQTRYAHCSKLDVSPGQVVEAGTTIARIGSTGVSSGAHLHFEVRIDDTPVNPRDYFDF